MKPLVYIAEQKFGVMEIKVYDNFSPFSPVLHQQPIALIYEKNENE
jgi:hypothetical protein